MQRLLPERISLTGFSERTTLLLSASGLKAVFPSGATVLYQDYLQAGFTVGDSSRIDLVEVGTDGTFRRRRLRMAVYIWRLSRVSCGRAFWCGTVCTQWGAMCAFARRRMSARMSLFLWRMPG
jgi:hypothetical protein